MNILKSGRRNAGKSSYCLVDSYLVGVKLPAVILAHYLPWEPHNGFGWNETRKLDCLSSSSIWSSTTGGATFISPELRTLDDVFFGQSIFWNGANELTSNNLNC